MGSGVLLSTKKKKKRSIEVTKWDLRRNVVGSLKGDHQVKFKPWTQATDVLLADTKHLRTDIPYYHSVSAVPCKVSFSISLSLVLQLSLVCIPLNLLISFLLRLSEFIFCLLSSLLHSYLSFFFYEIYGPTCAIFWALTGKDLIWGTGKMQGSSHRHESACVSSRREVSVTLPCTP